MSRNLRKSSPAIATLIITSAFAASLALAPAANATQIITFGQTLGLNTITGTASLTGTTWGGTDIPVLITQIAAPGAPINAFLDVTASCTSGATNVGGLVGQHFAGSF